MTVEFFKSLWGWEGTWREALAQAASAGFSGVEGPLPREAAAFEEAKASLQMSGVPWIAEISTTGFAAPAPGASVEDHLIVLRKEIERALPLRPRLFTCMAGDDCWPLRQSISFFREVTKIAQEYEVTVCCETHRARGLFHPRITAEILAEVPELCITADFSHWCNVCERLVLDEYPQFLDTCLPHIRHIHARVGYEQGAQVPDLQHPRFRRALEAHLRWWKAVRDARQATGAPRLTITPEFGPDGYQQISPVSGEPFGDLWEMNRGIAGLLSSFFSAGESFSACNPPKK